MLLHFMRINICNDEYLMFFGDNQTNSQIVRDTTTKTKLYNNSLLYNYYNYNNIYELENREIMRRRK